MSAIPSLPFGELLRHSRLNANLTQEALAELSGLSERTISDLERGLKQAPHKDTLARLTEALHLSAPDRARFEAAARRRGDGAPSTVNEVPPTTRARSGVLPLVGRIAEMNLVERHLAGEGSSLLLLAGEPGIGKSRLLYEAARHAQMRGWTVLEGGCHRRSGQEPYAPLLNALGRSLFNQSPAQQRQHLQGCGWLARLLPELAEIMPAPGPSWTLPPEQERRLMFAAVARYLVNIAGSTGTLLVLDDLHWAGADALDLLASLVRSAGPVPLRVIGAYRSTEVRPQEPLGVILADLAAAGLAAEHPLRPLAPHEARTLLTRVLEESEHADTRQVEQMLERAGGVPFFLVSCAEALRVGASGSEDERVPWNVAQSIRQRVALLSEEARALLGAAAVLGRQMERTILLGVATRPGQNEEEMLVALEAASQARLLLEAGENAYQFPHDLIWETVLAGLSAARRASWHRRVVEVLQALPDEAPVEALAHHASRAGLAEQAIHYLERAGDRALAMHAYAEAERYYRELVEWLTRIGRREGSVQAREKLGAALADAAHYAQALEEFEQVAAYYQTANAVERLALVTAQIVRLLAQRGTPQHNLARLQPILERLETSGPSQALADVQVALAHHYLTAGEYPQALPAAQRATDLARTTGADHLLASAEAALAYALMLQARGEEALQAAEQAIIQAEAVHQIEPLCQALHVANVVNGYKGELARCRQFAARSVAAAEQMGHPWYIALNCSGAGRTACLGGEWKEARVFLERALATGRQIDGPRGSLYPLIELGRLRLAEGALEEACSYLDEAIAKAETYQEPYALCYAHSLRAELDILQGHPQAAQARLAPLLAPQRENLIRNWALYQFVPMLAWAELERGEVSEAQFLVTQGALHARTSGDRCSLVDILWVSGLVAERQDQWQEAEKALEDALELARAMPYPHAEIKALYVYGRLHTQKRQLEPARARFEAALAICTQLGERLYAGHIEAALARLEC